MASSASFEDAGSNRVKKYTDINMIYLNAFVCGGCLSKTASVHQYLNQDQDRQKMYKPQ